MCTVYTVVGPLGKYAAALFLLKMQRFYQACSTRSGPTDAACQRRELRRKQPTDMSGSTRPILVGAAAAATATATAVALLLRRRLLSSQSTGGRRAAARLRAHFCRPVEATQLELLRQSAGVELVDVSAGDAVPVDAEILIIDPRQLMNPSWRRDQDLAALPSLRALVMPYAGILPEHLVELRGLLGDGRLGSSVMLHNLHHNAPMTAEMGVALLLAAAKRLVPADRRLRQGDWRPRGLPFPGATDIEPPMPMLLLEGRTALVLGFGALGSRVARVLLALGMNVLATRRTAPKGGARSAEGIVVHPADALPQLLPQADVLMVCVPSTAETRQLIGEAELALLPDQAIVVNVGRGEVLEERALYEALRSGKLHGAGIDVWYSYPKSYGETSRTPPSSMPFGELDSVVLSPHRGGGIGILDTELLRMRHLGEMLRVAALGQPMPNAWNFDKGY